MRKSDSMLRELALFGIIMLALMPAAIMSSDLLVAVRLLLFCLFLILVPGRVMADRLGLDRNLTEVIAGALCMGFLSLVVMFLLVTKLGELTSITAFGSLWIYPYSALFLFLFLKTARSSTVTVTKGEIASVSLIAAIVMTGMLGFVLPNVTLEAESYTIVGPFGNDGALHVSFMGEYLRGSSPQLAHFAGVSSRGYHTVHDIVPAMLYRFAGCDPARSAGLPVRRLSRPAPAPGREFSSLCWFFWEVISAFCLISCRVIGVTPPPK